MALSEEVVRQLAGELWRAETDSAPVPPLGTRHPDADIDDAYRIQLEGIRPRIAAGEGCAGTRWGSPPASCGNSSEWTGQTSVTCSARCSIPRGEPLPVDALIAPRVEPELAFVLNAPLQGPGVTVADVLAATAFVLPALEIIDSRIQDWKIGIVDTVAGNASSARVVLGGTRIRLDDVDPRLIGVVLRRNGEAIASRGPSGRRVRSPTWSRNTANGSGWGTST